MEEKRRPLIIEVDEVKQDIVQSINNALQRIPCYFVDMILTDITAQVRECAKNELARTKTQIEAE